VRRADFSTTTKERTLREPVDADDQIFSVAWALFQDVPLHGQKVRLLGVTASGLDGSSGQLDLFAESRERSRRAMRAVDSIRKKFGSDAIGRASQARPARERTSKPRAERNTKADE
jgi:DNA polymerase-4